MQTLDPGLAAWLADFNARVDAMVAAGYKATAIGAREALAHVTQTLLGPGPAIAWVNDDLVPGRHYDVPVRIYHPAPADACKVLLFLHGGGHTAGSVTVYDPICRRLAAATGHIVVAPEYRLAPENPYPAGLEDACTVARGVFGVLEKRKLAFAPLLSVAGDSAGGALAATVSARAQHDPGQPLHRQVLIYPCVDYTLSHPSVTENGTGYFLTVPRIRWYYDNYFQHAEDRLAASPLHGAFTPRLPATLVITAGLDPLRDEARSYLARLAKAGVQGEHAHFPTLIHAFLNMERLVPGACADAYRRIADFLNR